MSQEPVRTDRAVSRRHACWSSPIAVVASFSTLYALRLRARKVSSSADLETAAAALKPGEWVWAPEIAPAGPMLIYVDLSRQIATVLPQRRAHRRRDDLVGQGRPRDADRSVHHPAERRQPPLQQVQRRAYAVSGAADLGRRGAPRGRPAGLSRKPRLRAPALQLRQGVVQRDPSRRHRGRWRATRSTTSAPSDASLLEPDPR